MSIENYAELDATSLVRMVKRGEVSPTEVIESAIERAEVVNPKCNFIAHELYDSARAQAADASLPDGPLQGVPWVIKELASSWEGLPFTNSLPYLKDMLAPMDSVIATRLKQAGVIPLAKVTSPEQGWCLATESSLHGITRSPWDLERTPGGSSGGTAVAVSAGVTPLGDASDGGGSIRVPAANCGLVGLKPARGRITLTPLAVDYWYGGAVIFGLSRSVRDTALLLDVLAGGRAGEPYTPPAPSQTYLKLIDSAPKSLRIAMVTEAPAHGTAVDAEVARAVNNAAKLLTDMGHAVEPCTLPGDFWTMYKVYTALIAVQTTAFFDAMAEPVGRAATEADMARLYWTMIQKGREVSGPQHSNDIEQLRQLCLQMVESMSAYDVWLMPTLPMLPRTHGYYDLELDVETYDNTRMGPDCCFTAPFNATGQPAVSLPLGWSNEGLPIGVQLVGPMHNEALLLQLARQLELAQPWSQHKPGAV